MAEKQKGKQHDGEVRVPSAAARQEAGAASLRR